MDTQGMLQVAYATATDKTCKAQIELIPVFSKTELSQNFMCLTKDLRFWIYNKGLIQISKLKLHTIIGLQGRLGFDL